MTLPERVKAHLWRDISKMAEDPGRFAKRPGADFTRSRKLDFQKLIRFLISMQSNTTAHELLNFFDYDINTLSNSAFYQQRQKLLPNAFPFLLRQFNSHFPLALFKNKYVLAGCDGCEFSFFRNPEDPDTFHPPGTHSQMGFNSLHAISLYDLLSKRYLDCVFQPGMKNNEFRAFCDLADRYDYPALPIFIADRGFASYNVFAHVIEKGAFFLIRAKDRNVSRLLKLDSLPDSIDTRVDIILTRTHSIKKWSRPDLADQYRYVSKAVQFDYIMPDSCDEYPLSLRIVRFQVAEGIFENVITNLPSDEFPPDVLMQLYHLRWGVETSFRDLKHIIGTVNFHSKKPKYIEQEIWARLILFNFCTIITLHVVIVQNDTKHIYQVNLSMAMKICHHFIRLRRHDPPLNVEDLIGRYSLPVRFDRNFARLHRFHPPASFCYRFS